MPSQVFDSSTHAFGIIVLCFTFESALLGTRHRLTVRWMQTRLRDLSLYFSCLPSPLLLQIYKDASQLG
jgi:hypothetical protein